MEKLNNEQLEAVMHKDGPMLTLAGPGSGKTFVLVMRICALINKYGVAPEKILVLTFSKEAALEMKTRFYDQVGHAGYPVHFGTFHAVFYHILKKQGLYNESSILTHREKLGLIKDAGRRLRIKEAFDEAWQERILSLLPGFKKKSGKNTEEIVENNEEREVLELYLTLCKNNKKIDFDDMILECIRLLKSIPKVLKKWQDKYDYILVDEFQDIDHMQYEILKLLAGDKKNIFMVGDDDQSIYGFRGADPMIMQMLKEDFEGLKTVKLCINYRSGRAVTESAQKLISNNKLRYDKVQSCGTDSEGSVSLRIFKDAYEEAEFIADEIEGYIRERDGNNGKDKGSESVSGERVPERIGILYRTVRSADHLEEVLKSRSIRYIRDEKRSGYFDNECIKDIMAYFLLAGKRGSGSELLRILNRPKRGLLREALYGVGAENRDMGDMTVLFKRLKDYYACDTKSLAAVSKLEKDIGFIGELPPKAALTYILKGIGYMEYTGKYKRGINLSEDRVTEHKNTLQIRESGEYDLLAGFEHICGLFKSLKELIEYYLEYTGAEDENRERREVKRGAYDVVMQTIHASKGLEYETVYVIGLQEGIFPHRKMTDEGMIEEERRLLYVAMTRAKKKLCLCGRRMDEYGKRESRFLREIFREENEGS
ncbi:MAG: ATP-dependent helicase [Lachnospiraceae bacterium]|nr:ATP-dependent helicase [Lachnospiraceae bacterium]